MGGKWCRFAREDWGTGRGGLYHPASRESAVERMQGVCTQGFWVSFSVIDPIAVAARVVLLYVDL